MKKNNFKKMILIYVFMVVLIALPAIVYGYNYYQYKDSYDKAVSQLKQEKYDDAVSKFNNISNSFFGKNNIKEINSNIENAKKLKESKKIYDDGIKLFNEKKYIEAIDSFKKIPKEDTKRSDLSKKKIEECKSLYISLNLESAKSEGKAGKYDSAINYVTLALNIDSANKDALALKEEYTKAKLEAEAKAKQEVEAKAKKEAEEKAKQTAAASANQAPKSSEYPKVVCINDRGIFIYYNEAQEKDPLKGATWVQFGFDNLTHYPLSSGFDYNLIKLGPGPQFKYTNVQGESLFLYKKL